jgi:hypothetical protein
MEPKETGEKVIAKETEVKAVEKSSETKPAESSKSAEDKLFDVAGNQPLSEDEFVKEAVELLEKDFDKSLQDDSDEAKVPDAEAKPSEESVEDKQEESKKEEKQEEENKLRATSWAEIQKRGKEQRQAQKELKEREVKIKEAEEIINALKGDNPYDVIEKYAGEDAYKDWTYKILEQEGEKNVPKEDPKKYLDKKFEAYKAEQTKKQEDTNAKLLAQYKSEIEKESEAFDLVTSRGAQDEAFKYAVLFNKETGKVLSPKQANEEVEEFLKVELKKDLETKYGKELLKELAGVEVVEKPEEKQKEKTLDQSSTGIRKIKDETIPFDDEAIFKEAIALM